MKKTKPFDLKRALKGEPVVLRNGRKAYVRHLETRFETAHPLIGYSIHEKGAGSPESWTEEGHHYWDEVESMSDIIGVWVEPLEPLVFEHWNVIQDHINYLAKDADGSWFGYTGKPTKEEDEWNDQRSCGFYPVDALKLSIFPECDWKNSLIKRPEK